MDIEKIRYTVLQKKGGHFMTEKQYRKADSMVLPTVLVVMIGIILNVLGLVTTKGGSTILYAVIVVGIIGVIIDIIVYKKLRGTKLCGQIMLGVATVVYAVMVVSIDFVFFYILIACVLIIEMAYLEIRRIVVTSIIAIPVFTAKTIYLWRQGAISPTEMSTTVVVMVFVVISVLVITKLWNIFNTENINVVKVGAEKQKEATERMTSVSENIITYFDEANGYVQELTTVVDTSNVSMQNIATSIDNTAREIQKQTQMCQDIQNNTQNAKEQTDAMVDASKKALDNVSQGAKAMEELHNHAQMVEKDNKETVIYVKALNDRAKQVADILSTIVNISSQTNLLALNASIEAARAGEAGKGFAVVADEIRELSEQTKEATENITEILTELNNDVKSVTTSINHSVGAVEQQNELIEATKTKFDEVDNGVNELMPVINRFKKVIEEITDSAEVIAEGITELSTTSEEVSATSDEGTQLMTKAVNDMGKVNASLTNIYNLAQELKSE